MKALAGIRASNVFFVANQLGLALLLLSVPPRAMAQNPDVCIENGGTAQCIGPEVGEFTYVPSSPGSWGGGGFFATLLLRPTMQGLFGECFECDC